jgi:hypothetical protein
MPLKLEYGDHPCGTISKKKEKKLSNSIIEILSIFNTWIRLIGTIRRIYHDHLKGVERRAIEND